MGPLGHSVGNATQGTGWRSDVTQEAAAEGAHRGVADLVASLGHAQAVGDEELLSLVQSPGGQVVHGRGADDGREDPGEVGGAVGEVLGEVPDGDTFTETGAQILGGSQRQVGGGLAKRLTRLCAVDGRNRVGRPRRHESVRWVLAHDNTLHSGDLQNEGPPLPIHLQPTVRHRHRPEVVARSAERDQSADDRPLAIT